MKGEEFTHSHKENWRKTGVLLAYLEYFFLYFYYFQIRQRYQLFFNPVTLLDRTVMKEAGVFITQLPSYCNFSHPTGQAGIFFVMKCGASLLSLSQ